MDKAMLDLGHIDYRIDRFAFILHSWRVYITFAKRIRSDEPRIDRLVLRLGSCNLFT